MPIKPAPGQVIRYSYLWKDEHLRGREEGSKDRPCVVVIAVELAADDLYLATVLPVTHTPPADPSVAVELPHATKMRLGLDDNASWIVLSEANRFRWPGPDLRPIPDRPGSMIYGALPHALIRRVRLAFTATMRARRQCPGW